MFLSTAYFIQERATLIVQCNNLYYKIYNYVYKPVELGA